MSILIKLCEITKKILDKSNEILNLTTNITIDNRAINITLPQEVLEANCIKYANLIKKHDELMNNLIQSTSKVLEKEIEILRELVVEENKILNSLDPDVVDEYSDKLESLNERYYYTVIDRVRERLMIRSIILNGKNIEGNEFLDNPNIEGFDFDIHDVILAMVHIDVFKILKSKIDNIYGKNNNLFRRDLYEYYERAKFKYFNNIPTLEFVSLLYNADMSKVPSIDINDIKKCELADNEELDDFFICMAQDTIDIIASINDSDLEESLKNTEDVFDYLFDITLFEVLISYMDIPMLHEVSDYCNEIMKDDNKINIGHINNLVKKRLKD